MSLFSKLGSSKSKKEQNLDSTSDVKSSSDSSYSDSRNSSAIGDDDFNFSASSKGKKKQIGNKKPPSGNGKNGGSLNIKLLIIPLIFLLLFSIYFLFGDSIKEMIFGKKNINVPRTVTQVTPLEDIRLPQQYEEDSSAHITSDDIIDDFSSAVQYDYLATLSPSDFSIVNSSLTPDSTHDNPQNTPAVTVSDKNTPKAPPSSTKNKDVSDKPKNTSSNKADTSTKKSSNLVSNTGSVKQNKPSPSTNKSGANASTSSKKSTASSNNKNNSASVTKEKKSIYDANNLILEGEKALNKGMIDEALDKFTQAYAISPSPQLNYYIIDLNIKSGQLNNASQLLMQSDISEDLRLQLLQDMYEKGAITEAMSVVDNLLRKDTNGDFYYFRGFLFDELGDYDNALSDYKTAMLQSNYNPYYIYAYARILDIQKNYTEAIEYYKAAATYTDDRKVRLNALQRIIALESM